VSKRCVAHRGYPVSGLGQAPACHRSSHAALNTDAVCRSAGADRFVTGCEDRDRLQRTAGVVRFTRVPDTRHNQMAVRGRPLRRSAPMWAPSGGFDIAELDGEIWRGIGLLPHAAGAPQYARPIKEHDPML
jgi:hypothetical protein